VRIWDTRTGQPVSDPLRSGDEVLSSARFSPDGRQVVNTPHDGTVRIWEVPHFTLPIPAWLPALTEAVIGHRLTKEGSLEIVPVANLFELKRRLESEVSADVYTRWARWFFADRSTRTISAESSMTVKDLR
jgi:WD40 repeat protein